MCLVLFVGVWYGYIVLAVHVWCVQCVCVPTCVFDVCWLTYLVCMWWCMLAVQVVIACVFVVGHACVICGVYGVFVFMCMCDVYMVYMV